MSEARGMGNGSVKNGVCSSESVNGGQDMWSCDKSAAASADHLVVMVHGILGSSKDWKFAAEQFVRMIPDKVFVHRSERNTASLTLDGVDVMGDRLAEEILELIKQKPSLRKISFVAHSVGGLVARYVIGRLFRPPRSNNTEDSLPKSCEELSKGTIGGLEPMNFITAATPHLGSRGNKQVPFLFGSPALETTARVVIHLIFRRTGRHLFLVDNDDGKPPLLKRMIEDYGECCYMSALGSFKRRVAYSNVRHDHIVGWRTSSIRRNSELPKWEDSLNEKYPHIVFEEHCKACDMEQCEPTALANDCSDKLEEELVTGLSRVSWEKVDVSFHSCKQRSAAHSLIQAEDFSFTGSRPIKRSLCLTVEAGRKIDHPCRFQLKLPPFLPFSFDHAQFVNFPMDLSLSRIPPSLSLSENSSILCSRYSIRPISTLPNLNFKPKTSIRKPLLWRHVQPIRAQNQDQTINDGFVLEDVPHLTTFLPNLPSYPNPLQRSQAYAIVKQTFVSPKDVVAEEIVIQKNSPRGVHFRRAGPRERVGHQYTLSRFISSLRRCVLVLSLAGGGYRGFYSKNTMQLTPKVVNDIHKRGGTFLQTSRGGHDTNKIVDNIHDRGINQVYIIGGDGTQKGAAAIYKVLNSINMILFLSYSLFARSVPCKMLNVHTFVKEVAKRGLQVAVAGIPKTIDNDIAVKSYQPFPYFVVVRSMHASNVNLKAELQNFDNLCSLKFGCEFMGIFITIGSNILNLFQVIDKSFGFDTAVEEAQRAINAAHVEVESVENGVGIVKLMGRYSGFIAMFATLASRDVDCCLIPESHFYLEGQGGLFEFIEQRVKENGHMVIVLAEGAGQEYLSQSMHPVDEKDASGNRLLLDVGLWLTQKIKDHFTNVRKMAINLKYIDPTYMIRAIPSNASDNIYCTLLAQSAVHGAMAGYTGFTVGPVNSRHAYIPISRVTETHNVVKVTDRMWARLLASTNQPSFLQNEEGTESFDKKTLDVIN
ncbi:hypothetical protein RHGRI_008269 [Rhododendron griersonianum]|uniref:ATP-dependent 6-phosphofructokinase n=1 Tax=Rhododendron griersonianum TaxID=479676 RepID=A0AAV6L073_9ERIC|nr:hypothetical protein RHGRI_008269 [Rhododendron griersonianum]KAG5558280.1 hypothetical protein RHGRI_008269 [Rhododendron griersonianum]